MLTATQIQVCNKQQAGRLKMLPVDKSVQSPNLQRNTGNTAVLRVKQ